MSSSRDRDYERLLADVHVQTLRQRVVFGGAHIIEKSAPKAQARQSTLDHWEGRAAWLAFLFQRSASRPDLCSCDLRSLRIGSQMTKATVARTKPISGQVVEKARTQSTSFMQRI